MIQCIYSMCVCDWRAEGSRLLGMKALSQIEGQVVAAGFQVGPGQTMRLAVTA